MTRRTIINYIVYVHLLRVLREGALGVGKEEKDVWINLKVVSRLWLLEMCNPSPQSKTWNIIPHSYVICETHLCHDIIFFIQYWIAIIIGFNNPSSHFRYTTTFYCYVQHREPVPRFYMYVCCEGYKNYNGTCTSKYLFLEE